MSGILRTVGIDISKDWLNAFAAPEGRGSRFRNDRTGFRKLIAWIGSGVDRIAYEPSGPFHRDLEETLLKAGLPLYAINPFQVRSFARSLGRLAKTDAVDARMLATMAAAVEDLRPTEARSEGQRDLAELQQIRDALSRDRTATINRGKHLRTPVGKRLTVQRLRQIERQLEIIDAEIRQRLEEEKALERRAEILTSIPGISDITATGLIVHLPELGTLTPRPCRQPRRAGPGDPGVRLPEGTRLHPGRQAPRAQAALHAGDGRRPPQSRPQAEVRGARGPGQTAQGRPDGRDAEAPHPRQHARAARPHLDGASAARALPSCLSRCPVERRALTDERAAPERTPQPRRRGARREPGHCPKTGIRLTWILAYQKSVPEGCRAPPRGGRGPVSGATGPRLVTKPSTCELFVAQIVQSITRGIE